MRYILSIFLFSILLQNIITNQDIVDRMDRASITLRNLLKYKKEKMRKLQDNTDDTPEGLNTVPTDIPEETQREAAKTLDPKPVSYEKEDEIPTIPPITPQKNGTSPIIPKGDVIQIKKFHKFDKKPGTKLLTFGVFFYFLNKPIVRSIIMRVFIKYSSTRTLRGLDEDTMAGESVQTVCEIKPEYESYVGSTGNGDNIDYNCNAKTSSDRGVSEAKIDTNSPMVIGKEKYDIKEIEFHEDSAEGANNLQEAKQNIVVLNIDDANDQDKNKLILTGKYLSSEVLKDNGNYDIEFYDIQSEGMKTITCLAKNEGS